MCSSLILCFCVSIYWSFLFIYALIFWVNELQIESNAGSFSVISQKTLILGYKIFLSTETMIFLSCFWSFIHFGFIASVLMNFTPFGISFLFPFSFSLANVVLLLYSTLPLHASQIWIKRGVKSRTLECISQTISFGLVFIAVQLKE